MPGSLLPACPFLLPRGLRELSGRLPRFPPCHTSFPLGVRALCSKFRWRSWGVAGPTVTQEKWL